MSEPNAGAANLMAEIDADISAFASYSNGIGPFVVAQHAAPVFLSCFFVGARYIVPLLGNQRICSQVETAGKAHA